MARCQFIEKGAASSLVAAALGGACGHGGEGYVGLHTALLVIVAFFSVAMAARLHVRPVTEALAAGQRKLPPLLPGWAATGFAAHARRRDYTDAGPVVG